MIHTLFSLGLASEQHSGIMSYNSSEGAWPGTWTDQSSGQDGARYAHGTVGHQSRTTRSEMQPTVDVPYYQHRYTNHEVPQYPYSEQGMHRNSYDQRPVASGGTYSAQTAAHGYTGGYQPVSYTNVMSHHNQQYVVGRPNLCARSWTDKRRPSSWSQAQSNPPVAGNQVMAQMQLHTTQAGYAGSQLLPVAMSR